jgi:hypothetical protein
VISVLSFEEHTGLRAVGVHQPEIFAVGVEEDDLRPVGRDVGVAGVIAKLLQADADDRDDVDAEFFLRTNRAAYEDFGSILEPFETRSTETKGFRHG